MNWAMLTLRAKAILPVIFGFNNGHGQSWPSEGTIAALSGLSRKTVRQGINDLVSFPGLSYSWKMTQRGRQSKRFTFEIPGRGDNEIFFFHKIILSGGNWRMLKPVGKAVYPVLRTFSGWDKNEADEELELSNDDEEIRQAYGERQFDYSELRPGLIAKYSGIERSRVYDALKDLTERSLIARCYKKLKVFIIPPKYYKRDFLNEQLIKSFGHESEELEND